MLRVFQRACVRAGIEIQYSQGFNPRPKLSLPLPRPVGVASDDELLCLRCSTARCPAEILDTRCSMLNGRSDLCDLVKATLSKQLPEGCELFSVNVAQPGTSFQPCSATYVLAVQQEYLNEQLKTTIEQLLASESISVQRQIGARDSRVKTQDSRPKNVDVRGFLKSIKLDRNSIIVECKISSAGSIRVDEILKLLELDVEKLAFPIRRTNVQWKSN